MTTLTELYSDADISPVLPDIYFVKGCIFAVSAAPEIPMPETWMPWIISTQHTITISHQATDKLAEGLLEELRQTLSLMRDNHDMLPEGCVWSEEPTERLALESWLTGLLQGHQRLQACWGQAWEGQQLNANLDELAVRLKRCLKLFSTLASTEVALSGLDENKQLTLKQNLPLLSRQLPAMLKEYVHIANDLAQDLPNQFEMFEKKLD